MTLCDQLAEIGAQAYMSKTAFPLEDLIARVYKRIEQDPNKEGFVKRTLGSAADRVFPVAEAAYDAPGKIKNLAHRLVGGIKNMPSRAVEKGVDLFKRIEVQPGQKSAFKNMAGNVADRVFPVAEAVYDAPGKVRNMAKKVADTTSKAVSNGVGAVGRAGTEVLDATAKGLDTVTEMARRGGSYVNGAVGRMRVPRSASVNTARTIPKSVPKALPHNPLALAAALGVGLPSAALGGMYMMGGNNK